MPSNQDILRRQLAESKGEEYTPVAPTEPPVIAVRVLPRTLHPEKSRRARKRAGWGRNTVPRAETSSSAPAPVPTEQPNGQPTTQEVLRHRAKGGA